MGPVYVASAVRAAVLGAAMLVQHAATAQTIEDHSLPRSGIKTYHVRCSGQGRLAMLRFDMRKEPVRACISAQDGSKPQECVSLRGNDVPAYLATAVKKACK